MCHVNRIEFFDHVVVLFGLWVVVIMSFCAVFLSFPIVPGFRLTVFSFTFVSWSDSSRYLLTDAHIHCQALWDRSNTMRTDLMRFVLYSFLSLIWTTRSTVSSSSIRTKFWRSHFELVYTHSFIHTYTHTQTLTSTATPAVHFVSDQVSIASGLYPVIGLILYQMTWGFLFLFIFDESIPKEVYWTTL